MSITIIRAPKIRFVYPIMVYKTYKFFKGIAELKSIRSDVSILIGNNKQYHVFVYRYNIRLYFESNDLKTVSLMEQYLDYMFNGSYIGIDEKYAAVFNLKNTKIITL